MNRQKRQIAVVGGGASGMMAAIQAASAGAETELYEQNTRVGKKLLSTGNGKCNFSNKKIGRDVYYGSAVSFYEELFSEFGVADTIDFFGQNGMLIKDKNGYLYPLSEQASTVLDILRYALQTYGVQVHTECRIEEVLPQTQNGRLKLRITKDSDSFTKTYDAVILACGGMAAPKTGSDGNGFTLARSLGHHIIDVVPALVQLRCKGDFWKSVAGVRTEAQLTLSIDGMPKEQVQGELQLTDYGISGIPVFQFSREASYAVSAKKEVTVRINFLPRIAEESYENFWQERWERQAGQTMERFLTGICNQKINALLLKLSDIRPQENTEHIPAKKRKTLRNLYRSFTVTVLKPNGFEQAQVCAGGIPAGELTQNLESKYVPNLYFAGEIIDIDGICGGYNLQWAWTSGAKAGRAAAMTDSGQNRKLRVERKTRLS